MRGFFTVSGEAENTIVIERSKFICHIKGIDSEEQAKEFIESVRKAHSMATHNCYAYIADDKGLVQKFSDDNEPQGTAGLPMLEVLKNKKLYKTVAVVTRYFGGIKLGTGGLTRAYAGSVSEIIEKANVLNMQSGVLVKLLPDYEGYSRLLKLTNDQNVSVISTEFENSVAVTLAVKEDYFDTFKKKIADTFYGKLEITELDRNFFSFR